MSAPLIARRIADVVRDRLAEVPVVALQGPRSVGKSTVVQHIAAEYGAIVVDLDDVQTRRAVDNDPAAFVGGLQPVFIDEFQRVPDILDAIKVELGRDFRPGRFLITGSSSFEGMPIGAQALTGRVHFVPILPFSQGEIAGVVENFLDVAVDQPERIPRGMNAGLSREDYAERICAGGMPIAVQSSPAARRSWFDQYATVSLKRDVTELSRIRRRAELPGLLTRLAAQTGQVLNATEAGRAVGLDKATTHSYVTLLEDLFLIRRIPAWGRTLRARSGAHPKLHVVDSGLAARLLRITPEKLSRRDPASLTEFGHLLETFTVGELLKQASWADDLNTLGHWRTHDGHEVDLIVERHDGVVTGFEVKAGSSVGRGDLKGLLVLRDMLGDQFNAGFVLTTGNVTYQVDDKMFVAPIDRLWHPIATT